jgi:hypothetical protein
MRRHIRYTRVVNDSGEQISVTGVRGRAAKTSWWSVLGWAAYLACSWTWCIGMFLPALLVRDYGIWGFVVFAVPNVLGAGAMGWVLRDGAAERIVEKHRAACAAFSIVTIAFQAFFLGWIPLGIMGDSVVTQSSAAAFTILWMAGTAVAVALLGLGYWKRSWTLQLSAALILLSSFVAAWFLRRNGASELWSEPSHAILRRDPPFGLALLAPVCLFGFAFCPYLDLTFLRARQSMSHRSASSAFAFGFGVPFFAMILITLLATPLFLLLLGAGPEKSTRQLLAWILACHLLIQLWFTIEAHAVELTRKCGPKSLAGLGIAVLGVAIAVAGRFVDTEISHAGLSLGEIVYRCFMSFYGLIFPAYVWLSMIPTADGHSGIEGALGRRKLIVLGVACALAAPCYWMGFIERVEWWLAPGLGVVLLARLLVRGRSAANVG